MYLQALEKKEQGQQNSQHILKRQPTAQAKGFSKQRQGILNRAARKGPKRGEF